MDDIDQQEQQTKEEKDNYEVKAINKHRRKSGENQYLVKWKEYKEETWEPESNLEHLDLLAEYKAANRPHYSHGLQFRIQASTGLDCRYKP